MQNSVSTWPSLCSYTRRRLAAVVSGKLRKHAQRSKPDESDHARSRPGGPTRRAAARSLPHIRQVTRCGFWRAVRPGLTSGKRKRLTMKRPRRHTVTFRSWTLTEAKAKFSSIVQKALDGQPQRITRGGRQAVILIDEDTYRTAAQPRKSALELFAPLRGTALNLERRDDDGPAALTF